MSENNDSSMAIINISERNNEWNKLAIKLAAEKLRWSPREPKTSQDACDSKPAVVIANEVK